MSKQNIARIILGILIFVFSFLVWYFLDFSFNGGDWAAMVLPALVVFIILGAAIGLFYLIEEQAAFFMLVAAAVLGSFAAFAVIKDKLSGSSGLILSAAVFASFLFFSAGARNARLERSSRIKIIISLILRKGLAPVLTAIFLFGALIFYWSPYARSLDKEIIVPRPLFDAISAPIIKSIAGADIADTDFFSQLYQTANLQINALGKPYQKFIPLGAAVTLFFTFKFLGIILIWPMIFLDWLALKILIRLGVVNIKKIMTEKETIEI